MPVVRLGAVLWSQATDWPAFLAAAMRAEELGYDHIWTWDHLYPIFGPPDQPIFEGYTALSAIAHATSRAQVGLFVGANTFRNPGLAAKAAVTIDHVSGGRAVLGIGGAWFGVEHTAYGIDFGTGFGQRLDWLDEASRAIRTLIDGGEVTSPAGGTYRFARLRLLPPPLQPHLPMMIGGSGERKTLRTVARDADIWNAFGDPATIAHKDAVLRGHCADIGRDPDEIERTLGCKVTIRRTEAEAVRAWHALLEHNRVRPESFEGDASVWTGTPEMIAERMVEYRGLGFHSFLCELPAPYDAETMETLTDVVRPMVEAMPVPA